MNIAIKKGTIDRVVDKPNLVVNLLVAKKPIIMVRVLVINSTLPRICLLSPLA